MLKIVLIPLSLVLMTGSIFAQGWKSVNFPTEEQINGIFFVNPDTGCVITAEGNLIRTENGGKSWNSYSVTPGKSLEDLFFLSSDSGFVCGMDGSLLVTGDGGQNWKDLSNSDTLPWFFDVEMFGDQRGMVIGISRSKENKLGGMALQTTDGGQSWQKMEPLGMGYSQILYLPGGMAYFLSYGQIHSSSDKGKSWSTRLTHQGPPARTISMFDRSAILAGPSGLVCYSDDAGHTWKSATLSEEKLFVTSAMTSEKDGYLAGINTSIMKTSDGGKTWGPELGSKSFQVLDMFVIENYLWAVGEKGGIMYKIIK